MSEGMSAGGSILVVIIVKQTGKIVMKFLNVHMNVIVVLNEYAVTVRMKDALMNY